MYTYIQDAQSHYVCSLEGLYCGQDHSKYQSAQGMPCAGSCCSDWPMDGYVNEVQTEDSHSIAPSKRSKWSTQAHSSGCFHKYAVNHEW